MRILALCEQTGISGGTESYLRTLRDALLAREHEMRVVTRADLQWSDEHDPPSRDAAARLRALCTAFRPDAIALHSIFDAEIIRAARESARNLTYHLHDHRLFCPNGNRVYPQGGGRCRVRMGHACAVHALAHGCVYGPRPRTLQLISRREEAARAAFTSDRIVVFSEFMAATARNNNAPAGKVAHIAPAIDAAFFRPQTEPHSAVPAILFSGRVEPAKGLHSLIHAIASIAVERRPAIVVAGDGPDLPHCVELAHKLGCELQTLGLLDRAGVIAAIDRANIVAMPSLWDEPFGLSGIEALARGRPVAAYNVGAIGEWIGDGGIVERAGDTRALGRAIEAILQPRRWARYAVAAAKQAQRYRLDQHVDAIVQCYETSAR